MYKALLVAVTLFAGWFHRLAAQCFSCKCYAIFRAGAYNLQSITPCAKIEVWPREINVERESELEK